MKFIQSVTLPFLSSEPETISTKERIVNKFLIFTNKNNDLCKGKSL